VSDSTISSLPIAETTIAITDSSVTTLP
jgi:hypothetical protein